MFFNRNKTGGVTWLVYLLTLRLGGGDLGGYFFGTLFASLYAEAMARIRKFPAIAYLVISIFPLIPGAGVYYTMNYAVQGQMDTFATSGMHTAAIAGIIAMMPKCIVLDEATAMLDPVGRRETVDTIKELNEKYGITVVLITHHMDEAAQAQRLVVMAGGHIIDDGPPREVFQHVETLRAAGLTVPETVSLLYELRQEGFDVPLDALSDEECAAVLEGLLRK